MQTNIFTPKVDQVFDDPKKVCSGSKKYHLWEMTPGCWSQHKLSRVDKFEVSCDGKIINLTNSVKYLGITLDENLKGESIAKSVVKKASGRLSFLYRQGHFINQRTRGTLCTALIQCHFDYCCSSWFSSLSAKWKHKLQVMQNKTSISAQYVRKVANTTTSCISAQYVRMCLK